MKRFDSHDVLDLDPWSDRVVLAQYIHGDIDELPRLDESRGVGLQEEVG